MKYFVNVIALLIFLLLWIPTSPAFTDDSADSGFDNEVFFSFSQFLQNEVGNREGARYFNNIRETNMPLFIDGEYHAKHIGLGTDLEGYDLSFVILRKFNLANVSVKGATLNPAWIVSSDVSGVDFSKAADLQGLVLYDCNVEGTILPVDSGVVVKSSTGRVEWVGESDREPRQTIPRYSRPVIDRESKEPREEANSKPRGSQVIIINKHLDNYREAREPGPRFSPIIIRDGQKAPRKNEDTSPQRN